MNYTLEKFISDCRAALHGDDGRAGREKVRLSVKKALKDKTFIAKYLGKDNAAERKIVYEDPEFNFCICTHVYVGPKKSMPHDHGSTWAIYGQAVGETKMTDWRIISPPNGDVPGKVEMVKSYWLRPGDAHLYDVGAIHAPIREAETRLIRIEGQNTENIQRTPLEIV
tara:strand:+ start:264 stop:767 length:504 start_codon:yes stop_codon:yes gene_type:complete